MSYIGNPIVSTDFPKDTFSGNGSTTAFTMAIAPASVNSVIVVVSGITQDPSTYTISGTTLTFSAAPPTGTSNISVRHLGVAGIPNVPALASVVPASINSGYSLWNLSGSDVNYTAGSVGIGTTSPQDTIHIQGISRIQSTAGAACYWRYDNTANSGGKIWRWGDGISAHGTFSLYNQTDGAFVLNATSTGNLQFNSGYGSAATAYGCRAWVNFNGTGTVAIRASGNVSSITDNGTGQYTINFTTAMPDTNYSVSMGGITNTSGGGRFTNGPETSTPTTSAFRIICTQSGVGSVDFEYAYFQVFR